jgi:hypothetical protein
MRQVGHVAIVEKQMSSVKCYLDKLKVRDHMRYLVVDGKIK